jgi:two-component sensor histidine kinase
VLVVVAELVSNAVQHASGAGMRVTVTRTGEQHVRLAVIDRSRQRPRVQPPQSDLERGRGMLLVAGLAQEWGVDVLPGGKIVWADLAVDP